MSRGLNWVVWVVLLLTGCIARVAPPGAAVRPAAEIADAFVMPDGTLLPYRAWLPAKPPAAVVLALHGMNDSRDAWEVPGPDFAAAGIAMLAPDLRGFGATRSRGLWPGVDGLVADIRVIASLLRARYPDAQLILMGESMGAAALMVLAAEPNPPPANGYVLIAPAVWGRTEMNWLMRASLWIADQTVPGLALSGSGIVKVTATDNRAALTRLANDPLTIHSTRVDAIKGLVDLMDRALASARHFRGPALFLYGGHDNLVPPRATATIWKELPHDVVRAFYPNGYHLLLRDRARAFPIGDILFWILSHQEHLPSGADKAASGWMEHEARGRADQI